MEAGKEEEVEVEGRTEGLKEVEVVVEGGRDCGGNTVTTTATAAVTAAAVVLAVEKDNDSKKGRKLERETEKGDGDGADILDSIKKSLNVSKNKETDSMNVSNNYVCGGAIIPACTLNVRS